MRAIQLMIAICVSIMLSEWIDVKTVSDGLVEVSLRGGWPGTCCILASVAYLVLLWLRYEIWRETHKVEQLDPTMGLLIFSVIIFFVSGLLFLDKNFYCLNGFPLPILLAGLGLVILHGIDPLLHLYEGRIVPTDRSIWRWMLGVGIGILLMFLTFRIWLDSSIISEEVHILVFVLLVCCCGLQVLSIRELYQQSHNLRSGLR